MATAQISRPDGVLAALRAATSNTDSALDAKLALTANTLTRDRNAIVALLAKS